MASEEYTLTEAAAKLNIDRKTLAGYLEAKRITPQRKPHDGRVKMITKEQFEDVAALARGRGGAAHAEETAHSVRQLEEIRACIQVLQGKVQAGDERRLKDRTDDLDRLQDLRKQINDLQRQNIALSQRLTDVETLIQEGEGGQLDRLLHRPIANDIERMVAFIEQVAQETPKHRDLYITFQTPVDLFTHALRLRPRWCRALKAALDQGWNVHHLIMRSADKSTALTHVATMFELLDTPGRYQPVFFEESDVQDLMRNLAHMRGHVGELIVGKGVGAFEISLSSEPRCKRIDLRDPQFRLLLDHVRELAENRSVPLFTRYEVATIEFSDAIAKAEAQFGHRGLIMHGLSQATVPPEIHRRRAASITGANAQWARRYRDSQIRRINDLDRVLRADGRKYRIQEVCTKHAIREYIQSGFYSLDDPYSKKDAGPLSRPERKIHLQHIITRLKNHENYEFGLLEENEQLWLQNRRNYWMIKEGHSVLLESWRMELGELDLCITEKVIVDAFWEYFRKNIWETLAPANRQRETVIEWLEECIAAIQV